MVCVVQWVTWPLACLNTMLCCQEHPVSDLRLGFQLNWYTGPAQYYRCPKPSVDEDIVPYAGSKGSVSRAAPEALEKTATLVRNTVTTSGFLMNATKAMMSLARGPSR